MKLKEYLKKNRIYIRSFSETINYAEEHISSCISGKKKAGKKLMKAVELETKGQVTPEDWEPKEKSNPDQLMFNFMEEVC